MTKEIKKINILENDDVINGEEALEVASIIKKSTEFQNTLNNSFNTNLPNFMKALESGLISEQKAPNTLTPDEKTAYTNIAERIIKNKNDITFADTHPTIAELLKNKNGAPFQQEEYTFGQTPITTEQEVVSNKEPTLDDIITANDHTMFIKYVKNITIDELGKDIEEKSKNFKKISLFQINLSNNIKISDQEKTEIETKINKLQIELSELKIKEQPEVSKDISIETLLDKKFFPKNLKENYSNDSREINYDKLYKYFKDNPAHKQKEDFFKTIKEGLQKEYNQILHGNSLVTATIKEVTFSTEDKLKSIGLLDGVNVLNFSVDISKGDKIITKKGNHTFGTYKNLTKKYINFIGKSNKTDFIGETIILNQENVDNMKVYLDRINEEKASLGDKETNNYYKSILDKVIELNDPVVFKKYLDYVKADQLGGSSRQKQTNLNTLQTFYTEEMLNNEKFEDINGKYKGILDKLNLDIKELVKKEKDIKNKLKNDSQIQKMAKAAKNMKGNREQFANERGELFYALIEMFGGINSMGGSRLESIFGVKTFNGIIKEVYSDYKLSPAQITKISSIKKEYIKLMDREKNTEKIDETEYNNKNAIIALSSIDPKTIDSRLLAYQYKYNKNAKSFIEPVNIKGKKQYKVKENIDKTELFTAILNDKAVFIPSIAKAIRKITKHTDKQFTGEQAVELMAASILKFPNKNKLDYLYTIKDFNNFDKINTSGVNKENPETKTLTNIIKQLKTADEITKKTILDKLFQGEEGGNEEKTFNHLCVNLKTKSEYQTLLATHIIPYLTTIQKEKYKYDYNSENIEADLNILNPLLNTEKTAIDITKNPITAEKIDGKYSIKIGTAEVLKFNRYKETYSNKLNKLEETFNIVHNDYLTTTQENMNTQKENEYTESITNLFTEIQNEKTYKYLTNGEGKKLEKHKSIFEDRNVLLKYFTQLENKSTTNKDKLNEIIGNDGPPPTKLKSNIYDKKNGGKIEATINGDKPNQYIKITLTDSGSNAISFKFPQNLAPDYNESLIIT